MGHFPDARIRSRRREDVRMSSGGADALCPLSCQLVGKAVRCERHRLEAVGRRLEDPGWSLEPELRCKCYEVL